MRSFLDGITVWAYNILPALFPFAVLSTLAVKFLPSTKKSFTETLFGVDADALYLTSLLCGYPIGAKAIEESGASPKTATQLCSFCSSASPVFVVVTVGTKLLQSTAATIILFSSHLLSTVINGLLYRKKCEEKVCRATEFHAEDIGNSVTSSMLSVLSVGGLVALFYMLSDIIKSYMPQPLSQSVATSFALGLLEMTNGIVSICAVCDTLCATVLSSFLLSFGGMCVLAQSLAFLGKCKVHILRFLQMKFTQGSVATLLSFVLCKLFLRQ